jgi:hypothetical protein
MSAKPFRYSMNLVSTSVSIRPPRSRETAAAYIQAADTTKARKSGSVNAPGSGAAVRRNGIRISGKTSTPKAHAPTKVRV